MSLQAALDAAASAMTLVPTGGTRLGEPVRVALQPAPEQLTVTDLSDATLRATWISKEVLLNTSGPEAALRQAPPDFATITGLIKGLKPYLSNVGTFISPIGTPGLVGQLVAELPAVVRTELPVSVDVAWSTTDDNDAPLTEKQAKVLSATPGAASFLLAPQLVEATGGAPAPAVRRIKAGGTLTVTLPDGSTIQNTGAPAPLALDVQFHPLRFRPSWCFSTCRSATYATTAALRSTRGSAALGLRCGVRVEHRGCLRLP